MLRGAAAFLIVRHRAAVPDSRSGPWDVILGDNWPGLAYTSSGGVMAGLHHRYWADPGQRLLRPSPEARVTEARYPFPLARPVILCAPWVRSIMVAGPRIGSVASGGAFQKTSEDP